MEIKDLIRQHVNNPDELAKILLVEPDPDVERDQEGNRNEYNNDRTKRTTAVGNKKNFEKAQYSETETEIDSNGNEVPKIIGTEVEESTKLVFPFPQKITETAVAFLFGGDMAVETAEPDEKFSEFKRYLEKTLRLKSVFKKFARVGLSETKSAIVFYIRPKTSTRPAKIQATVLDMDSGEFYPYFDEYGDMVAFSRRFETSYEGEEGEMFEVFTAPTIYQWFKSTSGGEWQFLKQYTNEFQKIPVVYYDQDEPCWNSVISLIDKYEVRISRLSDTNDYFSEPIALIYGDPINLPEKGKAGKMLQFKDGESIDGKFHKGDAKYLTWDHSPDAIKMELEMLKEAIYNMSDTPDLSFQALKGLGNVANYATQLMFTGAEVKREKYKEEFDVAVERAVNVIKAGYKIVAGTDFTETDIDVWFGTILPNDLKDELEIIGKAVNDGILSVETAVGQNKLVPNVVEELNRIKSEKEQDRASLNDIMGSGE